jgi:integrase
MIIMEQAKNTELVNEFVGNKSGKATYKSWLNTFFETIDYQELVKQVGNYKTYIVKKDIENYFNDNRNEYLLGEIQRGPKAVTIEIVPDTKILKEILSYGDVLSKALFLTMASSGMRPGEAISLTFDDIELNQTPVKINVPYQATRTKEPRITFISSEAKYWVEQWLKVRDKYLQSGRNKFKEDSNLIFPLSYENLREKWNLVTSKAGYDDCDNRNGKIKNRHKLTPQKLRKFFKTTLSDAGIPFEVTESLLGHEEGMSPVYRRYTENQLKDWYLKGEEALLIFEKPVNQEEIDDLKSEMTKLQGQLKSILEFQRRVTEVDLEDEIDKEGNPKTTYREVPEEVIITAYENEVKAKEQIRLKKLADVIGDRELAKQIIKNKRV